MRPKRLLAGLRGPLESDMTYQTPRSREAVRQARQALRGMELAIRKARFARSGEVSDVEMKARRVDAPALRLRRAG